MHTAPFLFPERRIITFLDNPITKQFGYKNIFHMAFPLFLLISLHFNTVLTHNYGNFITHIYALDNFLNSLEKLSNMHI